MSDISTQLDNPAQVEQDFDLKGTIEPLSSRNDDFREKLVYLHPEEGITEQTQQINELETLTADLGNTLEVFHEVNHAIVADRPQLTGGDRSALL